MTFVVLKDLAAFKSVAKVSNFLKNTTVFVKKIPEIAKFFGLSSSDGDWSHIRIYAMGGQVVKNMGRNQFPSGAQEIQLQLDF